MILHSMNNLQQILHNLKIERLTPMQTAAAEAYGKDGDLILLSPTGSGKTLAYLLPLVESLRIDASGTVQAVVLVPSHELALQTENVFRSMGTPFKAVSCYGGRPTMEDHRALNNFRPAVIIATPGRLNDHLKKQNFDASTVHTLVIDEFDKCLELGFRDEMAEVTALLPNIRKRVLLSATDAEEIPQFVGINTKENDKPGAMKLNFLTEDSPTPARLNLARVLSPEKDKLGTLYRLLCQIGNDSTLVFVNHRESAARVASYLFSKRFPCDVFHGGLEQDIREKALYRFRNGSILALIATDLAARGLDIPKVKNVIHYHLPTNQEAFIHRNGRTARWEAQGTSYLILHSEEHLPDYLGETEVPLTELPEKTARPPKPRWATLYIGKGKKDKLNKVDIVGFLYKKGGLARDEVGQVDVKDHYAFATIHADKMKQTLTLVQGEKIKGMKTLVEVAK